MKLTFAYIVGKEFTVPTNFHDPMLKRFQMDLKSLQDGVKDKKCFTQIYKKDEHFCDMRDEDGYCLYPMVFEVKTEENDWELACTLRDMGLKQGFVIISVVFTIE